MSAVPAPGLQARWRALAPRERRLVALATVTVALGLIWSLAIEPAWRGRQRLSSEIPALRAQVAQIEALAAEARRLGETGSAAMPARTVREELQRSAAGAGLQATLVPAADDRGDRIEMRFEAAPLGAWLSWLDGAQRSLRLRTVRASVTRETASVTFELPAASPPAGAAAATMSAPGGSAR